MVEPPRQPTTVDATDTPWKEAVEHHFLAKRMFTYNYRLVDRYDRPVASLAVLADDSATWRPDRYGFELFGGAAAV